MDAFVELLRDNLRSLDSSSLQSLPNNAKLSSHLKSLEKTLSQILPALPEAMRQTENDRKAEKLIQEVTQLALHLEKLIDKLQSEAQLARFKLRARSIFTSVRFRKKLADLKVEFGRVALNAIPFSDLAEWPDQDQAATGRDDDLRNVMERLLSDEQHIAVLRIVGSPEIGKTTLARLVCDNDEIKSKFDIIASVPVSESFDLRRVSQDLLKNLGHEIQNDARDSVSLHRELQHLLSNKRFLIVLDQVGQIDSAAWGTFIESLDSAARGSRVLITMTTHSNTAHSMRSLPPYEMESYKLKGLTDEACWSLLASVAFPDKEPDEYAHLVTVGMKMVQKCKGHPLTTKALGRILRDRTEESGWESVLKMEDSLIMSYDDLTVRLKLCFAYCSIFPNDYKLVKETLMQFWMAEGLVQISQEDRGTTTLETVAERYFDILRSN